MASKALGRRVVGSRAAAGSQAVECRGVGSRGVDNRLVGSRGADYSLVGSRAVGSKVEETWVAGSRDQTVLRCQEACSSRAEAGDKAASGAENETIVLNRLSLIGAVSLLAAVSLIGAVDSRAVVSLIGAVDSRGAVWQPPA